jgi:hypothetical protein
MKNRKKLKKKCPNKKYDLILKKYLIMPLSVDPFSVIILPSPDP